jgi:hypothetical protein
VNVLPLWILAISGAAGVAILLRLGRSFGRMQQTLDGLRGDFARTSARIELLERQVNEYWQSVEMRIGRIHETFESGRACRMGSTVAEVDLKMGHLNRKMEDLLERMPRSGRTITEAL